MIWVTSDLHLEHANIIKYCRRPFAHIKEMNDTIIRNANTVIKPADTVYHLGDFALTKRSNLIYMKKQLNGHWITLVGNHDKRAVLKDAGFEVLESPIVVLENFILSHRPLHLEGIPCVNCCVDVHNFYPIPFPTVKQRLNLHGHVHNSWYIKIGNEQIPKELKE